MKKTICLWALLLIVVSCTNDDNYNDEHGDKAVIPPKGRIIRIMTYNIYGARATSPANAADLDALAVVARLAAQTARNFAGRPVALHLFHTDGRELLAL